MSQEKADKFLIENAFTKDSDLFIGSVDDHNFPITVRGVKGEYDPRGKTINRERMAKNKKKKNKDESGFVPLQVIE